MPQIFFKVTQTSVHCVRFFWAKDHCLKIFPSPSSLGVYLHTYNHCPKIFSTFLKSRFSVLLGYFLGIQTYNHCPGIFSKSFKPYLIFMFFKPKIIQNFLLVLWTSIAYIVPASFPNISSLSSVFPSKSLKLWFIVPDFLELKIVVLVFFSQPLNSSFSASD